MVYSLQTFQFEGTYAKFCDFNVSNISFKDPKALNALNACWVYRNIQMYRNMGVRNCFYYFLKNKLHLQKVRNRFRSVLRCQYTKQNALSYHWLIVLAFMFTTKHFQIIRNLDTRFERYYMQVLFILPKL